MVTVRPARRVPTTWTSRFVEVNHTRSGGVTDGVWKINTYFPAGYPSIRSAEGKRASSRDLSSVLSATVTTGWPSAPPKPMVGNEPKVVVVRPHTIHPQGLLPFADREVFVVAPNVYSNTGWCRRKLTPDELMGALDIPTELCGTLTKDEKDMLIRDHTFVPLKTTVAAIYAALNWDVDLSSPAKATAAVKRSSSKERLISGVHDEEKSAETKLSSVSKRAHDETAPRNVKATKADDAEVPEMLWDARVFRLGAGETMSTRQMTAVKCLRLLFLRLWKRRVTRDFHSWFKEHHLQGIRENAMVVVRWQEGMWLWTRTGLVQYQKAMCMTGEKLVNWEAGRDCLRRSANSDWWEWSAGSRPLFWRWPKDYLVSIRDGLPLWLKGPVARWRVPQRPEKDPKIWHAMRQKLLGVKSKGYLVAGHVESLTSFFAVPKGEHDIRMVYDGTKSGLNDTLWAPWFPLPTIDSHLRAVMPGHAMGDLDIGEMFLNFMMHERIQVYCGVDLTRYFPEDLSATNDVLWLRWGRCGMGFTTSPYQTVQGVLWAEEVIRGDPQDPNNPFRWHAVDLNLPGMPNYKPCKPWVSKLQSPEGPIANDLLVYVDDLRTIGNDPEECWKVTRRSGSVINYLGLQDASRKRRAPSREPGAWAGSIVWASGDDVVVMISQDRWDKTKQMLDWIQGYLIRDEALPFKDLESYRGSLVYVSRTYPVVAPYLKGIHLTLDSWRPWRKSDGWRMSQKEVRAALIERGLDCESPNDHLANPPKVVNPVDRLQTDMTALTKLFEGKSPTRRRVRPKKSAIALYGFADASGKGFGSSLLIKGNVHIRHGQWNTTFTEESSNFREFVNLVLAIEEAHTDGELEDCELFMFTDNTTAESAYYRGSSHSAKLFDLVLRLRTLQMQGDLIIHVIHVAGTRMIAEGTDGLSRGNLTEGAMAGASLMDFVPLHLSPSFRSQHLVAWVNLWAGSDQTNWLCPNDWFHRGHLMPCCVWDLAPAAAEAALEQLGKAIHKRPQHMHVVVCPRLLTSKWRKHLGKLCDLVFTTPVGCDVWDRSQHEPLVVGHGVSEDQNSWHEWKGCCQSCHSLILCGAGVFCANFSSSRGPWPPCRKVWCGRCYNMSSDEGFPVALPKDEEALEVVRKEDEFRFLEARNGDNLCTSFQCDLCQFRNIQGRDPVEAKVEDIRLLKCIRRASLDAFWSREPGTVEKTLVEARRTIRIGQSLGIQQPFPAMGPFPLEDTFGMGLTTMMLIRTLDSGRNDATIQVSTMRKMRSAYSNIYHASVNTANGVVMAKDARKLMVTKCPTHGDWFDRFMLGVHKRMGDIVRPDQALSLEVLHSIMGILDREWLESGDENKLSLAHEASFYLIAYCGALRGEEMRLLDITGMRKHWEEGGAHSTPHVVIALLGRFKGETGEKYHLMPMAAVTSSGLQIRRWVGRYLDEQAKRGVIRGPFSSGHKGISPAKMMETRFFERLEQVQQSRPELISPDVDVSETYGVSRSFRRGATSEAVNRGVRPEVIDANNRWRKVKNAGPRQVSLGMQEHYSDVRLIVNQLLKFSLAL